jgi:hypothetical protein
VPPSGWKPAGWVPPVGKSSNAMITGRHVHVSRVWGIPQFWLIWLVLTFNVTAGIGIIGMASPLLQEVFGGKLLGVQATFNELTIAQKGQIAAIAAAFTGLLSLFNIGGRFAWATVSDYIGRKGTYFAFFVIGIILSMYGGGFSTVPAYLADIFGTQMVGAIHGRLLTAWATAGVLGPVLVNYVREYQLAHGVPRAQVYDITMYILVAVLVLGFICNALVRPLDDKYFMSEEELANERRLAHERAVASEGGVGVAGSSGATSPAMVGAAWLAVGIPLVIGVWITLEKSAALFR